MPYSSQSDLPEDVQDALPDHGQEIYLEAFNSAYDQYKDPEDRQQGRSREATAHAVAWSAVKKVYHKNDNGQWVKNES